MGKAAGRREQQLEYARIIGASTEADIVRAREHNRRVIEGEPVTISEYAQAYSLTPTPADKRAVAQGCHGGGRVHAGHQPHPRQRQQ